jgi:ATPase subunit of ABC transporter with duplicated ATPase domains
MLEWYEGALIFVSHDQYFAEKIKTDIVYTIENTSLKKTDIVC